ncbi:MAG: hypothetical protein A3D92_21320, partial [Bacteroidetes bacterium RIFCSPHIGHO2_02_FULL_44_7]
VTGANGLLGQKLVALCLKKKIPFLATSKGSNRNPDCPNEHYAEMDITQAEEIRSTFQNHQPSHIIHTAALTDVDRCEREPELCKQINETATEVLVLAANEIQAYFMFISTDFVFDGKKGNYQEEDAISPLSEYGRSKARGEAYVQSYSRFGWSIVRTIIVYGVGHALSRSNVIVWAKGALQRGDSIQIIDDQFRAPSYAEDLAAGCIGIIEHKEEGIFHVAGPETLSIFEIVERIAEHYGYSMEHVTRISSAMLNQPAMRPPRTGFDLSKAYQRIHYKPHTLEQTLDFMFS